MRRAARTRIRIGLLVATCLGCAAQEPAPAPPHDEHPTGIRIAVEEVLVPAIVIDKHGHSVSGLSAKDFVVFEDDVEQKLSGFTVGYGAVTGDNATQPKGRGNPESASGSPQLETTVICIDLAHGSPASVSRSISSLEKTFGSTSDLHGRFVVASVGSGLQILQNGTTDFRTLRERLHQLRGLSGAAAPNTSRLQVETDNVKRAMESYCRNCACGRAAPATVGVCRTKQTELRESLDLVAARWEKEDNDVLAQLLRIIQELSRIPGPRRLVFVSNGFALHSGSELYSVAAAYVPNSSVFQSTPSADLKPAVARVYASAATSNIRIYTIDSQGVESPSFSSGGLGDASSAQMGTSSRSNRGGTLLNEMDSRWSSVKYQNGAVLEGLAHNTGGLFLHNSNDLAREFREAVSDGQVAYMLAYRATHTPDGTDTGFHKIRVEVKRPDVTVRAKTGYYEAASTAGASR